MENGTSLGFFLMLRSLMRRKALDFDGLYLLLVYMQQLVSMPLLACPMRL